MGMGKHTAGGPPAPGAVIGRGFADPVHDAHAAFRAVMIALSEPGRLRVTPRPVDVPAGMSPAMAAIALSLADFETPVWTDAGAEAEAYIRFHTGAPIVQPPEAAAFAFVRYAEGCVDPSVFSCGTLEYPDRSTTFIIEVQELSTDRGWKLEGPGIPGVRHLSVAPLGAELSRAIAVNNDAFPYGNDFIFCCDVTIAALPRSTRIDRKAG